MPPIIVAERASTEMIEPSWFQGSSLLKVEYSQPTIWGFAFSSGACISVECLWRLLGPSGIVLTSEDHGHKFGRPAAVQAEQEASNLLFGSTVSLFSLREPTLDLLLTFSNGYTLEVLPTSSRYEAWQIVSSQNQHVIAQGGGEISTYSSNV